MTALTSLANSAYQATAKLADPTGSGAGNAALKLANSGLGSEQVSGAGEQFQQLLTEAVASLTESGRNVEAQTMAAVEGKADMIDVVTAVAETEVALQSMVSLRDRVISSYEEIMRMPI